MSTPSPMIALLEKQVKRAPGSPAFARLADHYRSQGQVDTAITLCEEGVQHNPDYPTGHLLLGRCYFEKERVDEAISKFETVLKLDRKNLFALKIMGDIAVQKGRREEAASFYKKALDTDPSNTTLRDIFRRFEKYYTPKPLPQTSGVSHGAAVELSKEEAPQFISPSPAAAITEVLSTPSVDFMDEPVPAAPEPPSATEPENESLSPFSETIAEATDDHTNLSFLDLTSQLPEAEPLPAAPQTVLPEQPLASISEETPLMTEATTFAPLERRIEDFEETPIVATSDTEMVDLPPEMTGRREERVGDFQARKSVMARIMDEQSALLDALPEAPSTSVLSHHAIPEEVTSTEEAEELRPAPQVDPNAISSSAAGMDGFYSVLEENDAQNLTDGLSSLSAVELEESISEEEVPPSPPLADPLADLLLDIDADDSIKDFLSSMQPQPAQPAQPVPPPAPAPEAVTVPVEQQTETAEETQTWDLELPAEEASPPPPSEPTISSSAAGMDGFYSVSGATASDDEMFEGLQELDHVEVNETAILDEIDTEAPAHPAPDESHTLGNEVALDIPEYIPLERSDNTPTLTVMDEVERSSGIPEQPKAVSQSDIDAYFHSDKAPLAEVAATPLPEPVAEAPATPPEKTKPTVKKSAKKKTEKPKKSTAKVVSNVATMSLADIYRRQGHKEQALAVYKKLLKQDPANEDLKTRIETLKQEIEAEEAQE